MEGSGGEVSVDQSNKHRLLEATKLTIEKPIQPLSPEEAHKSRKVANDIRRECSKLSDSIELLSVDPDIIRNDIDLTVVRGKAVNSDPFVFRGANLFISIFGRYEEREGIRFKDEKYYFYRDKIIKQLAEKQPGNETQGMLEPIVAEADSTDLQTLLSTIQKALAQRKMYG
jgi:hypothetical protein